MKKLIAVICLISLLLGLSACGQEESLTEASTPSEESVGQITATQTGDYMIPVSWNEVSLNDGTWGYVTSGMDMAEAASYSVMNGYLVSVLSDEESSILLQLTLEGEEVNRISIPRPELQDEDDWSIGFYCFSDDSVWLTEAYYTLVDEETGEMSVSYTLKKRSPTGEELVSLDMQEHYGITDDNFICGLELSPEGNPVIITLSSMIFCDDIGNILSEFESENASGMSFVRDSSGRVYCRSSFENVLYTMDWENYVLGEPAIELSGDEQLFPGDGDFDLLLVNDTVLKGVSFESGTITELLSWADLDLAGMVGSVACLDEESYLVTAYDLLLGSSMCLRLSRVPAEEIPEKAVVTLAVPLSTSTIEWGGTWADSLDQMVATQMANFNRSSEKYRVEVVTYSSTEELQLMMLSGDAPDIIDWNYTAWLDDTPSLELFASKEYLVDLETLIDNDPELSMDDFIPSIMDLATERTNGLYAMPTTFYLVTIVGLTEYVGTEPGWSISDMLAAAEMLPEDMALWSYMTQSDMLDTILRECVGNFVDMDSMTCTFQTQEFYDLLTLCRDYCPAECGEDYTEPSGGSLLTGEGVLGRLGQFASDIMRNLDEQGKTLIGYPCDEGNGCTAIFYDEFSICALGDQQEGAWEFLRTLYLYDFQYNGCKGWCSVREDAFNEREDWYLEVNGSCTEEESMAARELVYGVSSIRNYTTPVIPIVLEEAEAYFVGDKTAEEVAAIIENRVNIYLAEQS